jgi:hypothetical protein
MKRLREPINADNHRQKSTGLRPTLPEGSCRLPRPQVPEQPSPGQCRGPSKHSSAVVQVGDGRGFVVGAGEYDRYVITAAHCLLRHPKPHLANDVPELTYANLIGPLAKDERTIWAGLVVGNLVDDVAVLAEPDGHAAEIGHRELRPSIAPRL